MEAKSQSSRFRVSATIDRCDQAVEQESVPGLFSLHTDCNECRMLHRVLPCHARAPIADYFQSLLAEHQRQPRHVGDEQHHKEHDHEKRNGVSAHLCQGFVEPVGGKKQVQAHGRRQVSEFQV